MAIAGQLIENKVAGFRLQWLETAKTTNGSYVKCIMRLAPKAHMPVRHIHPRQTEHFEILSGRLKLECDRSFASLGPGESATVPMGKPHQWWNESSAEELKMIVTMTPSYNWETQMEQIFGIMNAEGKLSFLQIMAFANEYEMFIAGPPLFFQKIMSSVLYPLARLRGLKKYYPEYSF